MPDGIGPGKGWDILVDGNFRVFHELKNAALEIADNLLQRNKGSTVRDRGTGDVTTVKQAGQLG